MTLYPNEPKNAAEMIARYRDVKRRLNTPAPTVRSEEIALKDLENTVAFVLAVAAMARDRAREAARPRGAPISFRCSTRRAGRRSLRRAARRRRSSAPSRRRQAFP